MSYRSLFRQPFVIRLLTGSWIGRLPVAMAAVAMAAFAMAAVAMAAVAIPLTLRHAGQPYEFVGIATAVYAVWPAPPRRHSNPACAHWSLRIEQFQDAPGLDPVVQ